ncbi:MAG TPA: hypothetical protein DIW44_08560 [Anaerolineaceae bacterium]|nr:hypothetical protein [Anaerolineaceae bacterium]
MLRLRLVVVLLLVGSLINSCSPKPPTNENNNAGTFSLDRKEVTFKSGDFKLDLTLAEAQAGRTVELKLEPAQIEAAASEGYDYISERYVLSNFPSDWQGTAEIRIKLPQQVLDQLEEKPQEYQVNAFITILYDQLPNSGGVSIPVTIDKNKKEAVISFESLASSELALFQRLSSLKQEGSYSNEGFTIQIRSQWGQYQFAESDHFTLRFTDAKDVSVGILVLSEFEKVFNEIKALGLSLGQYENGKKLPVYLEYLEDMDGTFGCNILTCPYISLNSVPFANKHVLTEIPLESIASIAHETFHLIHFIDHRSYGPDWDWLDEATAPWFERYYLQKNYGIQDYISQNAITNTGFFLYSQYSPPSGEARGTGYGASVFIAKLVDEYGTGIIKDLYTAKTADQISFQESLEAADASITIEWREFLETFITAPDTFYPGENKVDEILSKVGATINASTVEGGTELTFENLPSAPFEFTTEPGLLDMDGNTIKPLTVTMKRTMYEVQAKNFLIMFSNQNPFFGSGRLTISFEGGEFSGLMVYGIPIGATEVVGSEILAGSSTFLSTDNLGGGSELVINGFGTDEKARFDRLLLVPFSSLGTSSGSTTTPITIYLSFETVPPPTEMISTSMEINQLLDPSACDQNPVGAVCCSGAIDPCYVPSTNGETGGMGDGDVSHDCPPCRQVPEWCWSCKSEALEFLYKFDPQQVVMTINFDENGNLSGITDYYGPQSLYAQNATPQIQFNPTDGSFTVTYRGLQYNQPPQQNAYLIYKGVINGDTAQGTWTLGYDGIGEIASANWTAESSMPY